MQSGVLNEENINSCISWPIFKGQQKKMRRLA
jgi:hypothetical protein